MEGFRQTAKKFLPFQFLTDFLFPPNCAECGDLILEDQGLCASCWQKISYIEKPFCDRLGVPFEYDPGEKILSAEALTSPPPYGRARYVAVYDDVARSLIHKIKFYDQTYLGKLMGTLMVKFGSELLRETDIILPVPLHRRRLFMRRFNQAAVLANDIAIKSAVPVDPLILTRRVPTRSQIGLDARERQRNVAGAFQVTRGEEHKIKGKTILLVDDVVTSGSTIESCTKTLLKAGAKKVNIMAFARVTDRVKTL